MTVLFRICHRHHCSCHEVIDHLGLMTRPCGTRMRCMVTEDGSLNAENARHPSPSSIVVSSNPFPVNVFFPHSALGAPPLSPSPNYCDTSCWFNVFPLGSVSVQAWPFGIVCTTITIGSFRLLEAQSTSPQPRYDNRRRHTQEAMSHLRSWPILKPISLAYTPQARYGDHFEPHPHILAPPHADHLQIIGAPNAE